MTADLFTIPPTPATPLHNARARLAKAEAELESAQLIHDEQGDSAWYLWQNAKNELNSAKNSAHVEENRELEKLKQQTK